MDKSLRRAAPDGHEPTRQPLRQKLMFAASASILALVTPGGLYGTRVHAQALPTGCSDDSSIDAATNNINNGNQIADDGETIECATSDFSVIEPISTNVGDLTLVVGSDDRIDQVSAGPTDGRAVDVVGSGTQIVEIKPNAVVSKATPATPIAGSLPNSSNTAVRVRSNDGSAKLINDGVISSGDTKEGWAAEVRASVEGGDLTISGSGTFYGGVYAQNGIQLTPAPNTGTLNIDLKNATIDANGATAGLSVKAYGDSDPASIKTGTVTNADGVGISAVTPNYSANGLELSTYGATSGSTFGIDARNSTNRLRADGTIGKFTVKTFGDVTGTSYDGVRIYSEIQSGTTASSSVYLSTYANVTGGQDGINVTESSTRGDNITINALGTKTLETDGSYSYQTVSGGRDGIYAYNAVSNNGAFGTGATLITTRSTIEGGRHGINAQHFSTGDLTIVTQGDVKGTTGNGVTTNQGVAGTNQSITTYGDVAGGGYGIYAKHRGAGALTIKAYGDVTGKNAIAGNDGIDVDTYGASSSVEILTTGTVQGYDFGIDVAHRGSGALSVTTYNAYGDNDDGIGLATSSTGTTMAVTLNGTARGQKKGLKLNHDGTGDVTVTMASGAKAIGDDEEGINVNTCSAGAKTTIKGATPGTTSGDILGDTFGLSAQTNNGDITVENLNAVSAGTGDGISAKSYGGKVTIQNIGYVASENLYAIDADTRLADTRLADGSGGNNISIQNIAIPKFDHDDDPGNQDIASYGGIRARSGTGNINLGFGDLNDDADDAENAIGNIYVQDTGIDVGSIGGDININVAGAIQTETGNGIRSNVKTPNNSRTRIVALGPIDAGYNGIHASHQTGVDDEISIVAGDVRGRGRQGILADTTLSSTGLSIESIGTVRGRDIGIDAQHRGTGTLSVAAHNAYGEFEDAIELDVNPETSAVSSNIVLSTTGTLRGKKKGLEIDHDALGFTKIESAGSITGMENDGIEFRGTGLNSSLSISGGGTGSISGGIMGADLVTAEADILVEDLTQIAATGSHGLYARSTNGKIAIHNIGTVSTEGVVSPGSIYRYDRHGFKSELLIDPAKYAIDADAREKVLEAAAVAETATSDFVPAQYGYSGGNDISIQNVAVEIIPAGDRAVAYFDAESRAFTFGTQNLPETYSANGIRVLSGDGDINLGAEDPDNGTGIGNIYAQGRGIFAKGDGGDIEVYVDGKIVSGFESVELENEGDTGLMEVTLASVSSVSERAIQLTNNGSGETELTLTGAVSGPADQDTIRVRSNRGASVTVTETGSIDANGGEVALDFGNADEGDEVRNNTFTLYGRLISGNVYMESYADTFEYGGTLEDGVTVYGGDGVDTLRLVSSTPKTFRDTIGADGTIQEFEDLAFAGSGITLTGTHRGWQQVTFETGSTTDLDGALDSPVGLVQTGAILNARDNAFFIGNLTNSGTINIGSSPGRFTVFGDFEQTASGVLPIEIFRTGLDQLRVRGSATLDGTLSIVTNLNNLPEDMQSFEILTADLPIVGAFATITDNLPDLNFGIVETTADPTTITVTYTAPVVVEPDPTPDPDPDPSPAPTPDPDPVQTPDPDPTPEPEPEPLLSAKEIVPSGLSVAMRVNDMFVENLIQRRAVQIAPDQWSFWTNGFGGKHDVGVDNGTPGWDGDTSGLALGVERLISVGGNPVLFGAAGGYTEASITSDASHGDVEGYHLGAFANADMGQLFVAGSLAYAWQDYGFERAIIGPSSATLAYGETEGTGWALKSEAFYDLLADVETGTSFGPVATFGSTIAAYDGFKETGAGILNLNWSDESAYQTVLGLGGEGGFEADLNGLTLDTGLRVLYENVGGDRTLQTRAFLDVPGAQFKPRAATLDADRVAVSFDTKLYLTEGLFAHVRYDTTRGENLIDHEGWAGITLRF